MDVRQARVASKLNSIRHPWELARYRILHRLFSTHVHSSLGNSDWVLDVGCGDGFVSDSLSVDFPDLHYGGIDPELPEGMCGPRNDSPVVLRQSLTDVPCGAGTIGVILILDVLEHIEDDGAALRAVLSDKRIAEDAVVILFVPAFQWLFYSHDRVLSHYRRYNRAALVALAKSAGLTIREDGYFFFALLPIRVIEVLLEKLGLTRPKDFAYSSTWAGGPTLAWFIAWAMEWEFRVMRGVCRMGIRLPGLSTYAVCARVPGTTPATAAE